MSKAIKSVGNVVKKVVGGGNSPGAIGTGRFQGTTRDIDKSAFTIDDSKERAKRAEEREKESADRSKAAQEDRQELMTQLQARARGEGPSLAEAQLRSASERNLAQQIAAAQSQRGGSAAARERNLMRGQAQAGREVAQDAATARIQEQQQAQQMLAQQITQEQQLADQLTQNYLSQGFNIEQARQAAQQDLQAMETQQHLSAQGLSAAGFEGAAGRRLGLFQDNMSNMSEMFTSMSDKNSKKKIKKASKKDIVKELKSMSPGDTKKNIKVDSMEGSKKVEEPKKLETPKKDFTEKIKESSSKIEQSNKPVKDKEIKTKKAKPIKLTTASEGASRTSSIADRDASVRESKRAAKKSKSSSGSGLTSMFAMFSDKETKKEKKTVDIKKDFLDKLKAYTYEYKDKYKEHPHAGDKKYLSVMAQDLEKAGSLGKNMIEENEKGIKVVNYAKGYGAILAAQAHLNKRLEELEKKSKKRK